MKIVYIADSIIPSQTANSVHVMKMCQAFAANGHNVTLLISQKADKNLKIDDVYDFYGVRKIFKIIRLPFPSVIGGILFFSILSIWRAKKEKVDLVYTRFLYSCFLGMILKIPTIFEIHASSFSTKIDNILFNWISRSKSKKIVVISNALRDFFAKKYNIDKNSIIVAPDGADPVDSSRETKKKVKSDKLLIGYVGHLYRGRGINLIAKIASKCPWAEFHIIGGLPEDINFWKNELGNRNNVIFHGHVPHKEVYEYMLSYDALIAPYQDKVNVHGGGNTVKWMSPLKIFEYMATGKAILSSDLPAIKEILEHGRNSLLAPPGELKDWISNLEKIKKDTSLREELGKTAKQEFLEKYTWKSRANTILNRFNIG